MYRIGIVALALAGLVGCTPAPVPQSYRNSAQPIASAALFDMAQFQGDWQVVAAFGAEAGCGLLQERWQAGAGGLIVQGTTCGPRGKTGFATRGQMTGPGRIARTMKNGPESVWVLWVDADYRVAAIGTPSGGFGRILVRPEQGRSDLITAARDVLRFNGYDISQLKMLR